MEMGLSKRKGSPKVNLGFDEPWTGDVFALGFVKPVELCRGLLRTSLGFCEPVRITKCRA